MARHISAFSPLADRMMAEDRARTRRIAKIQARKQTKLRLAYSIGPTLLVAMGATVIASAQSSSPFANQKKVNAWELPQASDPLPEPADATSISQNSTRQASAAPRLQLRTRSLDAGTASSPPPDARAPSRPAPKPASNPTVSAPSVQEPAAQNPAAQQPAVQRRAPATTRSVSAQPRTQSESQAAPVARPSTAPPLSAPRQTTSVSRQASAAPSPYSSPLTAPPLNTQTYSGSVPSSGSTSPQSVPSAGYTYQPSAPSPAPTYGAAAGLAGSYGTVRRSSVNNPPTSVDNITDFTVHQVPPYYAPGQVPRQAQPRPQQWAQSNNPTAYDYGYGRPGERPPQWGGNPPNTTPPGEGPFSRPYPGPNSGNAPYPDSPYGSDQPNPYAEGPYSEGPFDRPQKRGFFNRMGLGGITTLIRGAIRAGIGARETNDWEETFIGEADLEVEISTVTQAGLEWGVHGQVRAQYDEGRKGFVRRLPDCPPTLAGCASITVPGSPSPASVRGHTSQFYTFGPDVAKDEQFALESAHLFLRSAYGDLTVGRDDGAALLFSLGAPTLLNVGASNSPLDYTGLDAVKTVNDASGFSEKVTYTSPRLLGDQVGVGVQLGLSYAPDAGGCGVDYCVDLNDIPNVVAPDIQDIMEAGLALDRTFGPGVSVEATGTYARGSEKSGLAGLKDLEAFNAGLEFKLQDLTLGASWLMSNQGVSNGDYEAYDVGVTWQPSRLGFTLGYGHADDDLVGLKSDQFVGGVSWDFNERMRVSLGGQYADRDTLRDVGGLAQVGNENVTAFFIEGGIRF